MPINTMSNYPQSSEVQAQAALISRKSIQLVDNTSAFVNAAQGLAQSARSLKAALTQANAMGRRAIINSRGETHSIKPIIAALKTYKDEQKSAADKVRGVYSEAMHFANFHADLMSGQRWPSMPLKDKVLWSEAQLRSIQQRLGRFVDSPAYTNAQTAAAQIVDIRRKCDHSLPEPLEPYARALREVV